MSNGEAIKVLYPLRMVPELVTEPKYTCLLMTHLLPLLIIWLAEMLILLRKNPLFIFSCFFFFQDPAQLVHAIVIGNKLTRACILLTIHQNFSQL